MADFAGNRWYKCDLHLHTMCSECYLDKDNTAAEWVARAKEQGLDVVAVTDHNDYRGIDGIMEEGVKQGLAVFPGVEITCDSSKIHMLILFDTSKKAENVRDFLNRCDIDSDHVGDSEGTSLSVFEVCEIAKKRGAMVIAAHIDEFSSVNSMNPSNLDRLFGGEYIDAVQVANLPVWRKYNEDKDAEAMQKFLQEKYGPDATPHEVERWRKCFNRAQEAGIPMLSFSDNQASPEESHHGLWGIGSVYTWIMMDDKVNLESIRQSLLTPDSRIRMMTDSPEKPKTEPDFWIRSLEVRKSLLNPHVPLHLDFHPQLNCIIGGKGSGKSAIIKILLGVYHQLCSGFLQSVRSEQDAFYCRDNDTEHGIFTEESEIEIVFKLYGLQSRLLLTDIRSMDDQNYTFYRTNPETGEEVTVKWDVLRFSQLFCSQVFAQRQAGEIAMTPGAFLDSIDLSIPDMHLLKARKEYDLEQLVNVDMRLHAVQTFLENTKSVEGEYKLLGEIRKSEHFPESLELDFLGMMKRRSETIDLIAECRKEKENLTRKRTTMLKRYEDCFVQIRKMRTAFISMTLADNDNYKIELDVMSDKDSFRRMIREKLSSDEQLIRDDLQTLENALFAKKNGVEKYTDLLKKARAGKGFSAYFCHLIRQLTENDFERMLLFRPEDDLKLFYHPNGVKRFFPMDNASAGERATAVLTFFMFSSNAPFIVDQPEDDMDNRIIYEELIGKLKRARQLRQVIVVTHNANISMNADPEMIISMDSWSKFKRVRMQGSADNDEIRREICEVIEGSEEAFIRRARKYNF